MKEAIKRINLDAEFYTPEKCYIIELLNTSDDESASIAGRGFCLELQHDGIGSLGP